MDEFRVQGRTLTAADLTQMRAQLEAQPGWTRHRFSQCLAQQWDWRNARGQWKDMAARTLLLKLERRGLIQLPPPRNGNGNRQPPASSTPVAGPDHFLEGPLIEFKPLL